jgi:hypothetical protein
MREFTGEKARQQIEHPDQAPALNTVSGDSFGNKPTYNTLLVMYT